MSTGQDPGDKRKAHNDVRASRKKANVVLEVPQALLQASCLHDYTDPLIEVDMVGVNAPTFPEFEVHEGHEKRIVGPAPHGLPSLAVRKPFSGHGLLLVALEWRATEKPNKLVVPAASHDDKVRAMLSDHKTLTETDDKVYLCKELAALCVLYQKNQDELRAYGVGTGDLLGTWRIVDKGSTVEVQCVTESHDVTLMARLNLLRVNDSLHVFQSSDYLKRLEKKQGGVISYDTACEPSEIPLIKM